MNLPRVWVIRRPVDFAKTETSICRTRLRLISFINISIWILCVHYTCNLWSGLLYTAGQTLSARGRETSVLMPVLMERAHLQRDIQQDIEVDSPPGSPSLIDVATSDQLMNLHLPC